MSRLEFLQLWLLKIKVYIEEDEADSDFLHFTHASLEASVRRGPEETSLSPRRP